MKKKIVVFAGNDCRSDKEKYYYSLAFETGKLLALSGFITVTGGGPGLMNEIMRGAYESGGETVSVALTIPGRIHSKFFSKKYVYTNLNPRQKKLLSLGDGFIALPGGVGTLFEIMEIIALKRKGEIAKSKPFVLIDSYYREFLKMMEMVKKEGFIYPDTDSLFTFCENPVKAIENLRKSYEEI